MKGTEKMKFCKSCNITLEILETIYDSFNNVCCGYCGSLINGPTEKNVTKDW